ncbi:TIGR01244 family sulfur transferase [Marinobacter sp. HL-58]|uniref:TIGR01244 family sulfur transferase n=1 Tax=Marinobacter sp. HL-58 TaxID=1479237 RepID=UPI000480C504|nr:TIGR01244 family sulfur transferase [Marinobacter sp. HL-58]KPQ01587.1 MAG: TIGR01244 family protein [Marinobacter sp. HL-58]
MKIHYLEPAFAVADTVAPEDMPEIRDQGFRAIICNRRPGEEGFVGEDAYAEAAARAGLEWISVPVASGQYSDADIDAFGKALERAPSPILGFCRTGRRAVHMWAHARAREPQCNIPLLLKAAHRAGHDPQPIQEMLESNS